MACPNDAAQIAFDQRDAGALHRDIGACAHRNSELQPLDDLRFLAVAGQHHDTTGYITPER